MSTEIDIYADNPVVTLDFQIAVMQAAREGKPLQCYCNSGVALSAGWYTLAFPDKTVWNWSAYRFRIDPTSRPRIASGHNPDKLTEEQVGVKEGWRLLEREEQDPNRPSTLEIQRWWNIAARCSSSGWSAGYSGALLAITYRTQRPPGYFLPKKAKVRVPLSVEDLPAVCWVRYPGSTSCDLVVAIYPYDQSLKVGGIGSGMRMQNLMDIGYSYSSDRKTWHPCWKEIEP